MFIKTYICTKDSGYTHIGYINRDTITAVLNNGYNNEHSLVIFAGCETYSYKLYVKNKDIQEILPNEQKN